MNIDFVFSGEIKFHPIEKNPKAICDDYLVVLQNVETKAYELGAARWIGPTASGRNWTITSRHIALDEKKNWGWRIVAWAERPKVKQIRKVDKSKKSNIKCEHCDFCSDCVCTNSCSPKKGKVNYWNRCKCFRWKKEYEE